MEQKLWYSSCAKGPVLYCLDVMSRREDGRTHLKNLAASINGLATNDFAGLENAFGDALFTPCGYSAEEAGNFIKALRRNWFDAQSDSAYFKEHQPVAPTYAAGVLKTLELSLAGKDRPKPIDGWWITGFSDVRFFNLVSEDQITFLVATPVPEVVAQKIIMGETGEAWMSSRHGIATDKL